MGIKIFIWQKQHYENHKRNIESHNTTEHINVSDARNSYGFKGGCLPANPWLIRFKFIHKDVLENLITNNYLSGFSYWYSAIQNVC